MRYNKNGILFGVSAHILWGLFPLYWDHLKIAGALEIVSNRAVWSLAFCLIVLGLRRHLYSTFKLLRNRDLVLRLLLSTIMISINWLVYIWAVTHSHVVEAALGYYINPIAIIALGTIFLHEKMSRLQWIAIIIAALGAVVLTIDYGRIPWISVALALSWSTYGFIKKKLGLESMVGLTIETLLSLPFYGGYIIYLQAHNHGHLGSASSTTLLLIGGGLVTAVPLLLFNGAVTRIPYTLLGLFQYITPTITFIIGVWVNHEAMPTARWFGFFVIWIALFALAYDLAKSGSAANNSIAQGD